MNHIVSPTQSAYPSGDFSQPEALIDAFSGLISGSFENPEHVTGTLLCRVSELDQGLKATLSPDLKLESVDTKGARPERYDAEVTIPLSTLARIITEYETVDWRDPSIIGTVELTGDMAVIERVARSTERPDDFTLDRFADAQELHAEKGYAQLTDIDRLHRPSQATILEYIEEGRPAIITGLGADIFEKPWTLERLEESFGDAIVRVRSAKERVTMRAFAEELRTFINDPHDAFTRGFDIPYTEGAFLPPEMHSTFGPLFFDQSELIPAQLWFGAVPVEEPTSSLHRDPHAGFLFQVMGRKRLDLYSADQAPLLYPRKAYNLYQPCWFCPDDPDFEKYPKAKVARKIEAVIEPGELILQPAGWFHEVYALDSPNMSVSYFWAY